MLSNLMFVPSIVHTDKTRRPRLVVGDQWSIDLLAIWRGLLQSLSWTFYRWNLFIHLKTSDRTVACCVVSSTATLSGGGSDHHSDKLKMATGFMSNCGWKGWWIVLLIERSLKRSVSPKLATIVVLCISVTFVKVKLTYYGDEVFLGSISWLAGLDLTYLHFVSVLTLHCCVLSWWRKFWAWHSIEGISNRNILLVVIFPLSMM